MKHLSILLFSLACSSAPLVPSASAQVVSRVIDGDTIIVATVGTVRLIGVDTPEIVDPRKAVQAFGADASSFLKTLVLGKIVRLEFEGIRLDRYNRTLAYVYLDDDTFVNREIIRQGYGFTYTEFPFRLLAEFRASEREARAASRGMWAATDPDMPVMFVNADSAVYHLQACRYVTEDSRPMSLTNAAKAHRPCAVCKPPRP